MSDLNSLQTKLTEANSVLVALPVNPDKDIVAAGLALYLSLKTTGKQIGVVSSSQPVVRDSHLVGLNEVESGIGGQNLVISVNLPEDAVDKVTSNVEGGHLNLILAPRPGATPITQNDLIFGTSGASADLIIVVGANNLTDLGALAEKEHELFVKDKLVNLSNKSGTFGEVNLTDENSSNSELVTAVLQELKLPLTPDIAGNLMQGIEEATSGLSSPTLTADTFEALAVLYRAGARRSAPTPTTPPATIINDTPIIDYAPQRKAPTPQSSTGDAGQPDWLKPKIFKGSATP